MNDNLKTEVIELLKGKGFVETERENQGLKFYTLEITDRKTVAEKILQHTIVGEAFNDCIVFENVKFEATFVVEIEENLNHPQWTFTGELTELHEFESVGEFLEYVETL